METNQNFICIWREGFWEWPKPLVPHWIQDEKGVSIYTHPFITLCLSMETLPLGGGAKGSVHHTRTRVIGRFVVLLVVYLARAHRHMELGALNFWTGPI